MFSKKMNKKEKSPQDSMDHEAKRSVITELRDVANEEMSKRMGGLKKPLPPSNEHPKSGLDAAQKMMDSFDHESEDPMASEPDGSTDEINQDSEYGADNDDMSADEIDRKIAELENRKRQLASK